MRHLCFCFSSFQLERKDYVFIIEWENNSSYSLIYFWKSEHRHHGVWHHRVTEVGVKGRENRLCWIIEGSNSLRVYTQTKEQLPQNTTSPVYRNWWSSYVCVLNMKRQLTPRICCAWKKIRYITLIKQSFFVFGDWTRQVLLRCKPLLSPANRTVAAQSLITSNYWSTVAPSNVGALINIS